MPFLVSEPISPVSYAGGAGCDYDASGPFSTGFLVYAGGLAYGAVNLVVTQIFFCHVLLVGRSN